jgi:fibronectin-binding autotransporter adhesin
VNHCDPSEIQQIPPIGLKKNTKQPMKSKRLLLFPSSIAASFMLLSPAVHADAITWDAGGGNSNWSTLLNWSDDAEPTGDDVTFNATGALATGTTNTVGASESVASLTYSQESATLQHTTTIAADQTLELVGNFLLAGGATATTATNATINGSTGTLTVSGTSFQVGQTTPTAGTPNNSLDLSGLGTLTANLGATGIFRLGATNGTTTGPQTTVKLAATSSITADVLGVGDKAGRGILQTLKLGSSGNTINANTIAVGSTNGRGSGNISFETSTGTLQLRAADGIAAVTTMNLINNGFGHNGTHTAIVDLSAHSVDAKIGALTMARRTGTGSVGSNATLTFNTGTLEVASVNMAVATNALMTGNNNATINIGGGTAKFGPISMATNSGGGGTTAALNFTGGSTTVTGGITRVGGTAVGTTLANLTLNGATTVLDTSGANLTNLTSITYTDGLFKNLGVVNTGMTLAGTGSRIFDQAANISGIIQGDITGVEVGLTKQGSGALALFGTNTYDGPTQIDAGGLIFGSKNAKTAAIATASALGSVGLGAHNSNALYYSAAEIGSLFNTNSLSEFDLDPASGVLIDTTNAGASFTQNVALTAARALTKTGTGTLILPAANTFTGNVQINGIPNSNTLRIEHSEAMGPIATAKTITLTGDNRKFAILELANNITVNINKSINTSGKSFIAANESAFGSPVFLRNASGNNAWLGNLLITAAGGAYAIESAAGTLTLGDAGTPSVLRNDVLTSNRAFNFLGAGNVIVNSQFVDTDATTSTGINKYGTGTLTLSRTDNQGTLATPNFSVGTTVVENMTASGTPSSIGSGTAFNFGGTFRHAGASNSSSDRPFGLVGPTPTLESSGTGSLALTSTAPVTLINGTGTPIALFALGDTVITARDAQTLFPGMTIAATGIATGTKITAVNYDTREITVDTPTTANQLTHQNATITGTANLDRTFTLGGTNTGNNLIAPAIANPSGSGKLSLTKAGAGKWILTGGNTYTGNTTISGGTLALGAANVLPDGSPVSISSATLDAATAGTENAGTLAVTGAATIKLASGAKIEFDDSSGTWAGTLDLTGTFVSGSSLKFGTTGTGLSASQLGQISATGFSDFALDTNGYLTATSSGSNFAAWANDPAKGDIPGEPADGDFDNDGITNLVEYALGKNPRVSSQPAGILSGNVITFTKGADAIANGDVSWVIETSQTLATDSWTPAVTQPAGDPSATISHTFTPSTPARNFARLKVTTP